MYIDSGTMKWIILTPLLLLASCSYLMDPFIIDHEKVQEIQILNRNDSSLCIIVTDRVIINDLLQNCLNGSMREPMKFMPNYQLDVKEKDTSYRIYVNDRSVNRGGATYRSSCDVEKTVSVLFR